MLTPRQRLCHKLRDGAYRARQQGCYAETVKIADALDLLAETNCYYCGTKLGEIYALEHKKPLARKGSHTLDNLCKACEACNQEKHIQTDLDFLALLDRSS